MRKIISLLALLLLSGSAFASVSVYDHAGVLTSGEQSALISNGSRWPFDLHVLINTFPNPQSLDSAVHNCVNGPNVVCIGIDPLHHKTNVHVGTATGIPVDSSVSSAGNPYFKNHDFQGGIEAIASRARDLYHSNAIVAPRAPTVYVNNQPVPVTGQPVQIHVDSPSVNETSHTGLWILFSLVLAGLVTWVIFRTRRSDKIVSKINNDMNDFRDEAFEMSSRNMETAEWHEKMRTKMNADKPKPMMPAQTQVGLPPAQPQVVVQPVSTPTVVASTPVTKTTVVHNHYGSNPGYGPNYNPTLTGSVMTDVLLANELSRPSAPVVVAPAPVIVEREVVRETVPADSGSSNSNWDNNDAGGSSSSWNDSSSSSSSSDWSSSGSSDSSSSSDWGSSDSGSSSDWGGGGGDSGGGSDSGW